jgi:hypothetical protein
VGDDRVHRATEGERHVRLALVDAVGREPLELAEPEVRVGQVRDPHDYRRSDAISG